jgi:hypothetical protein
VHERKCWTGYPIARWHPEAAANRSREERLACAEIAREEHQHAGLEQRGNMAAKANRVASRT